MLNKNELPGIPRDGKEMSKKGKFVAIENDYGTPTSEMDEATRRQLLERKQRQQELVDEIDQVILRGMKDN